MPTGNRVVSLFQCLDTQASSGQWLALFCQGAGYVKALPPHVVPVATVRKADNDVQGTELCEQSVCRLSHAIAEQFQDLQG